LHGLSIFSGKAESSEEYLCLCRRFLEEALRFIPSLVAAVQGYVQYERTLLVELKDLRSRALNSKMSQEQARTLHSRMGERGRGSIRMAVETDPNLKASQNFLQLQASLNEVYEPMSASRRANNAAVNEFINAVQMVLLNWVVFLFGFQRALLFEAPEAEKISPLYLPCHP